MSVRSKLAMPEDIPDWVENASKTTKALFNAAYSEYQKIKDLLSQSKAPPIRKQKINLSAIARTVGCDKSTVSYRRQPDLVGWINDRNLELQSLLASRPASKKKKRSNDLKAENAMLRSLNASNLTDSLRTYVQELLDSDLLNDRDKIAFDNIRLKKENAKLREQVTNLQALCRTQTEEIAKLSRAKHKSALGLVTSKSKD